MRGLGRLVGMLNPLDQSAVSQIMKANAGRGMLAQGLAVGTAGAKQIATGGYWRGKNLAHRQRGFGSHFTGAMKGATREQARRVSSNFGSVRQGAGAMVGAWAGLNLLAPESNLTTMANYGAVGGVGAILAAKHGKALYNRMMGG